MFEVLFFQNVLYKLALDQKALKCSLQEVVFASIYHWQVLFEVLEIFHPLGICLCHLSFDIFGHICGRYLLLSLFNDEVKTNFFLVHHLSVIESLVTIIFCMVFKLSRECLGKNI